MKSSITASGIIQYITHRGKRGRGMSEYTKEMSKSEILIELANIRTDLLNAVCTIEAIAKNIAYKCGDSE